MHDLTRYARNFRGQMVSLELLARPVIPKPIEKFA